MSVELIAGVRAGDKGARAEGALVLGGIVKEVKGSFGRMFRYACRLGIGCRGRVMIQSGYYANQNLLYDICYVAHLLSIVYSKVRTVASENPNSGQKSLCAKGGPVNASVSDCRLDVLSLFTKDLRSESFLRCRRRRISRSLIYTLETCFHEKIIRMEMSDRP